MKKLTALLLSLAMVFSLAACGNTANTPADTSKDDAQTPAVSPVEKPDDTNTPDDAETPDDANTPADTTAEQPQTGKTLVVYYSASGNTARVAKDIAAATGADLFEIVPTQVYTSDDLNWTNANSRVSREHDDESLRNVPLTSTTVADWSSYDTVFIGYPIWWGHRRMACQQLRDRQRLHWQDRDPLRHLVFLRHGSERHPAGQYGGHRRLAGGPPLLLRRFYL